MPISMLYNSILHVHVAYMHLLHREATIVLNFTTIQHGTKNSNPSKENG